LINSRFFDEARIRKRLFGGKMSTPTFEENDGQKFCVICGTSPASHINVGSAASFVIWWNKKVHSDFFCARCAEAIYLSHQKRSGRGGWFGPISFVYTVFSLIRNRIAIAAHRKQIPVVVHEGELYRRPAAKIRRDVPTVIITLLVIGTIAGAIITGMVSSANGSTYTDDTSAADSENMSLWTDINSGDCILALPSGNQAAGLETTDCTSVHSYQIFAKPNSGLDAWSRAALISEAESLCANASSRIDSDATASLSPEPDFPYFFPTKDSWDSGARDIECLIGNPSYQLTESLLITKK
jgi:hypothetical protein